MARKLRETLPGQVPGNVREEVSADEVPYTVGQEDRA